MVRGRRVRAAVACEVPRPDDCCSPNAKRKDNAKFIMPKCPAKTNQPITKYFQAVNNTSTTPERTDNNLRTRNGLINHCNDDGTAIHTNGIQDDTLKSDSIKSPATPHRIQLHVDDHSTPKTASNSQQPMQPPPPATNSKARKKPPNQTQISSFFPSVRRSVRKTKSTVLEEKQRCIEDLIRNKVEDGLMVRDFAGKGRGVVAARQFERGDYVVEYSGELIDMTEAKEREERYARDDRGCYMYYFLWKNKQYCIDATAESGRLGRLVNHSRNAANLCTRIVPVDGAPRLCLVARDAVPSGDELTYDYGDRSKESLQHHPWLAY